MRAQVPSLPSVSTLERNQNKISLSTGINKVVEIHITEAVSLMKDPREKVALLMWDELALSTHLEHDIKEDRVVGVEECGPKFRTNELGH